MPNLSDAITQPIPVITDKDERIRYTGVKNAVSTLVATYHNSIDSTAGHDKLWPVNSMVVTLIFGAPTSGPKRWWLETRITGALMKLMPVLRVDITSERIIVQADNTSDRAPSDFGHANRRN